MVIVSNGNVTRLLRMARRNPQPFRTHIDPVSTASLSHVMEWIKDRGYWSGSMGRLPACIGCSTAAVVRALEPIDPMVVGKSALFDFSGRDAGRGPQLNRTHLFMSSTLIISRLKLVPQ